MKRALAALLVVPLAGCIRAPSPLTPERRGSVGLPHRGTLSGGAEHIRVACSDEEVARGCERNGPERPWFLGHAEPTRAPSTDELVRELTSSPRATSVALRRVGS